MTAHLSPSANTLADMLATAAAVGLEQAAGRRDPLCPCDRDRTVDAHCVAAGECVREIEEAANAR